ncbi:hypothetical protein CHS0354_033963 [Potamilus streckersoni]|uniref:Uncharacterized protein n=1 Tax=Potamilus streckersoni TaxID=2493646 RepID=A0AAE0WA08_9BIVA|nr:hypothetical protein CHS0354_033963 [Potamilus streckersoni]
MDIARRKKHQVKSGSNFISFMRNDIKASKAKQNTEAIGILTTAQDCEMQTAETPQIQTCYCCVIRKYQKGHFVGQQNGRKARNLTVEIGCRLSLAQNVSLTKAGKQAEKVAKKRSKGNAEAELDKLSRCTPGDRFASAPNSCMKGDPHMMIQPVVVYDAL